MKWKIDKRGEAGEKFKNLDNGKGELLTDPNDIGIIMLVADLDRKAEVKAIYRTDKNALWVTYETYANDPHAWFFPIVEVKPKGKHLSSIRYPAMDLPEAGWQAPYFSPEAMAEAMQNVSSWFEHGEAVHMIEFDGHKYVTFDRTLVQYTDYWRIEEGV